MNEDNIGKEAQDELKRFFNELFVCEIVSKTDSMKENVGQLNEKVDGKINYFLNSTNDEIKKNRKEFEIHQEKLNEKFDNISNDLSSIEKINDEQFIKLNKEIVLIFDKVSTMETIQSDTKETLLEGIAKLKVEMESKMGNVIVEISSTLEKASQEHKNDISQQYSFLQNKIEKNTKITIYLLIVGIVILLLLGYILIKA